MHYMPAALIGEFAALESATKRRSRERPVWAARRGVDKAFIASAEDLGHDPKNPHLYRSEESNLDPLWQRAEGDHAAVQGLAGIIAETGVVTGAAFANVLVPYAAHLVARHPALWLDGEWTELVEGSDDHEQGLQRRFAAWARLADVFITGREWFLAVAPPGVLLTTTDIGWHYVPGASPGEVFMPVSPRAAFVIRGGGRSYDPHSEWVAIPPVVWEPWMLEVRRDAMMLGAPREVYAPTKQLAEHAISLWTSPAPERDFVDGAHATAHDLAMARSQVWAGLIVEGAALDPRVAFSRLIAIQHRWGCACEESLATIEDRSERRLQRRVRRSAIRAAEQMLREQGLFVRAGSG
jgi:hypothetical protein